MTHEIIDQQRAAAHPKTLAHELPQSQWIEMVREQVATDKVECIITKRESESVGHHPSISVATDRGGISIRQVRRSDVQQSYIQRDSATRQVSSYSVRNSAQAGCHFEQREAIRPGHPRHSFHHFLCGGDPAEPSINAPNNF
jgi:hypothetical protein